MRQMSETRSMRRTRMRRGTLKYPPKHPVGFGVLEKYHPTKGGWPRWPGHRRKRSNRS